MAEQRGTSILDDQPASVDALDFRTYVEALTEIVNHTRTKTPLTVGIFGHWGTGKTTLMRMLENELRLGGMATVWFNAWQYTHEEELWAAFLQAVIYRLRAGLRPAQRFGFRLRLLWTRIEWRHVPAALARYAVLLLLVSIPLMLVQPVARHLQPGAQPAAKVGGTLATLVLAVWTLGIPLADSFRQNASIVLRSVKKSDDASERIAFLDRFRDHFQDVVKSLPVHGDKRLAVFIDDLDRCSPEGTLEVLDAIKLFVDVPGCVFLLGLDVEIVQRAVATRYPNDVPAQQEFLGKIIQLPFHLPVLTQDEMSAYLKQLELVLPDDRCEEVFVTGLHANPRELKRALNVFALLWSLAAKRPDLAGSIKPVRLAKVVVIQHGYPELHRLLQKRPLWLAQLERFVRQERTSVQMLQRPDQLPTETRPAASAVPKMDPKPPPVELPLELQTFAQIEPLRTMLLLHSLPAGLGEQAADECSFASLSLNQLAVYFTLTSRAESPAPAAPPPPAPAMSVPVADAGPSWGAPGQMLGKYRVIRIAGTGGSSTVYQAEDTELNRVVALKMLAAGLSADPGSLARFEREAKTLAGLNHPNVIRVYEVGNLDGRPFYAMEWLAGGDLRARIAAKSRLTAPETAEWALPILHALEYAHSHGIVHRDLKPSSILFDADARPVLTDFSISRPSGADSEITTVGGIVGTPRYMAPEQWEARRLDQRTDLYSLGLVLFECLTGRTPFAGESGEPWSIFARQSESPPPRLRELVPEVPSPLDDLVAKLLEKDPNKRYQTAAEVAEALRAAVTPPAEHG